jgi:glucose-1-phosphate thymidylyltransferase
MWGIVPAAGVGGTSQPLAFSRDLSPVGSRRDGEGDRPRAVSEFVVDRLVAGGATRVCFVVAQGRYDLVEHFGAEAGGVPATYVVQPRVAGLCDAIFRALPLIRPEEQVVVGLPDTLWFPEQALRALGDGGLSFLCFPSAEPERFEAVVAGDDGELLEIRVQAADPRSPWVWGAFKLDGATLRSLHDLWVERRREDAALGTLVNAWLDRGGVARAVRAGEVFVDTSTPSGHREAMRLLGQAG